MSPPDSVIRADDRVLLLLQTGAYMMVHARPATKVRIQKKQVLIDPLIGCRYGSLFRVEKGVMVQINSTHADHETHFDAGFLPTTDNSELRHHSNAQKLTDDEIAKLKQDLSGEDLISALAANSATFGSKTEFSQEKWLKKKRMQYITEVQVLRPSALSMSRMYTDKKPDKVLFMRPDTLAAIISRSSLRPMSQVLVLDEAMGLVTASIAERLGGFGRIFAASFTASGPAADCVHSFGLTTLVRQSIINFPLMWVNKVTAMIEAKKNLAGDAMPIRLSEFVPDETTVRKDDSRIVHSPDQIQSWLSDQVDTAVVCVRHNIKAIIDGVFPLVVGGGTIVVYSEFIEPLQQLALKLRQTKAAILVQVSENWYREYQVLPNRTHPMMNMHGAGGYILSAIKVANPSVAAQSFDKLPAMPAKRSRPQPDGDADGMSVDDDEADAYDDDM